MLVWYEVSSIGAVLRGGGGGGKAKERRYWKGMGGYRLKSDAELLAAMAAIGGVDLFWNGNRGMNEEREWKCRLPKRRTGVVNYKLWWLLARGRHLHGTCTHHFFTAQISTYLITYVYEGRGEVVGEIQSSCCV